MAYTWKSKRRNYDLEQRRLDRVFAARSEDVLQSHPLTLQVSSDNSMDRSGGSSRSDTPQRRISAQSSLKVSTSIAASIDPLSAALDGTDPLSAPLTSNVPVVPLPNSNPANETEPWSAKKASILTHFATTQRLSISTRLIADRASVIPTGSGGDEVVQHRLEQLDDFEAGSVRLERDLTQHEYCIRIEELHRSLKVAWNNDQRVNALKIAIQCAKLLVDTSVKQFYPSKFVLITDILDNFGELVYERIHSKTGAKEGQVLSDSEIPEWARETCRNWFYKIASIRELIPRLYVEAAIMRSYSFLNDREMHRSLLRLTQQVCGIGDPLVAIYARCYLCRVANNLLPRGPQRSEVAIENLWHYLNDTRPIRDYDDMERSAYWTLYSPALEWILQTVAHRASDKLLDDVLRRYREHSNSPVLLHSILSTFSPEYVARRATDFIILAKEADEDLFPKASLFRALGLCLSVSDPPEGDRRSIMSDAWRVVTRFRSSEDYMRCAEVWIMFPVKFFTSRDVNAFLGAIIKQLSTSDRAYEKHGAQLLAIIEHLVWNSDLTTLCHMDRFMPFLDLLQQKDSYKGDAAKTIMSAFVKRHNPDNPVNDPVVVNTLMYVAKIMYNGVNALTLGDERRALCSLLVSYVRSVSFDRDVEQQLSFYAECRSVFGQLDDAVMAQLVQSVNCLCMSTRSIVRGHHTRKTAAFVKGCVAFCYISIPSLTCPLTRLRLYLLSGQVALFNQCVAQAEECFQAAIGALSELPTLVDVTDGKKKMDVEGLILSFACQLLSALLLLPDNPEGEPLGVIRSLISTLHGMNVERQNGVVGGSESIENVKAYFDLQLLQAVASLQQVQYAIHIDKVCSNDALYGGDDKFIELLDSIATAAVQRLLDHMKRLGDAKMYPVQGKMALGLLFRIVAFGDLQHPSLLTLSVNLWQLAHRQHRTDNASAMRVLDFVKSLCEKPDGKIYTVLHSKLQQAVAAASA